MSNSRIKNAFLEVLEEYFTELALCNSHILSPELIDEIKEIVKKLEDE
jgi:hypothetical protein